MKKKLGKDPLLPLAKVCIGFLMLLVIGIFLYRESGLHEQSRDDSPVVASRELHFYDTSKGEILITDKNGIKISLVGGEGGFMRAVVRGLAKERIALGIGPERSFRLVANKRGIISIIDPVTGSKVDVSSFGKANSEIFTKLLISSDNVIKKEEG
jgi:putative photosynthetic complex assembly protein